MTEKKDQDPGQMNVMETEADPEVSTMTEKPMDTEESLKDPIEVTDLEKIDPEKALVNRTEVRALKDLGRTEALAMAPEIHDTATTKNPKEVIVTDLDHEAEDPPGLAADHDLEASNKPLHFFLGCEGWQTEFYFNIVSSCMASYILKCK